MYSTIATWYLKPDCRADGISALKKLALAVAENEPDTWGYLVHSGAAGSYPPVSDDTIVFLEIYKDKAAFLKHVNGTVFTTFLKEHGDLFLTGPVGTSPFFQVENLDRIEGFLRPEAASLGL